MAVNKDYIEELIYHIDSSPQTLDDNEIDIIVEALEFYRDNG